jgi:hypothetical protein
MLQRGHLNRKVWFTKSLYAPLLIPDHPKHHWDRDSKWTKNNVKVSLKLVSSYLKTSYKFMKSSLLKADFSGLVSAERHFPFTHISSGFLFLIGTQLCQRF